MKFFLSILIFIFLMSCGNQNTKTTATDSVRGNTQAVTDSPYASGAALVASNDCLGCHKINEKNIGPSYDSIAQKYDTTQANIENLAYKIRMGGVGAWGNVPMPAHDNVTPQQAEKMVKYILSLRNK